MTVTAHVYGKFAQHLANGDVDLDTDTLKAIIVDNTYSQDIDAHEFLDDVQSYEVSGDGYTAGGATISNVAVSYDSANNRVKIDCDDVSWADSTITGRGVIVYIDSGTASTSILVCANINDADVISTDAAWTFTVAAGGLVTFTAA